MKRATLLIAGLCMTVTTMPLSAAAIDKQWNFTVYLDEKEIGYHRFNMNQQGAKQEVNIEARFKVKFFGIPFYTYIHDNTETWNGKCLQEITAITDDNGKQFQVQGAKNTNGFSLETQDEKRALPDCVSTFSYWDISFLDNQQLLNSQTGEYLDVTSSFRGEEIIVAGNMEIPARRYRVENEKFSIDVWYSANNEWLGLQSTTEGGRILRYVIE